jgi:hypothetical protein
MLHRAQGLQRQAAEFLQEIAQAEASIDLDFAAHRCMRTL